MLPRVSVPLVIPAYGVAYGASATSLGADADVTFDLGATPYPNSGFTTVPSPGGSAAEVLPSKGDEEMVKFNGAKMYAWRSRASHALQVDISVRTTSCAKIDLKKSMDPSEVEDADTLVLGEKTLATWKSAKPSDRFDAKRFEAENPDLYRAYVSPVPGARRMLLK